MGRINSSRGAAHIEGSDFSYGTAICKVCKKKFNLGKWQKDMTCIPCKVDHDLNEVKYICKDCGWEGSILEMKYVPPTKDECDFAYNLCPKCSNKIRRCWCGETDDWDHA